MKKKILFVIPSLAAGGGEKSLVNLLYQIDYDLYEVDLLLFSRKGAFLSTIPGEVNILDVSPLRSVFAGQLMTALKTFLLNGQMILAYSRLMFTMKNRLIRNAAASEQYTWKYQRTSFDPVETNYDVAIGYLEKSSIYFIVDKVISKKKIGWIHTNYSDSGMDSHFDKPYFKQLDHLVTVSEECAKALQENFEQFKNKIKVIYNIVSPKIIRHESARELDSNFTYDLNFTNIITVARLSREKGIDLAIKACEILVAQGFKVRWYVLGEGSEREKLEKLIQGCGLQNHFILVGIKENPYPYIKGADIYVQPSRYEGKSIAIDEAKILQKPIIVTNYDTAKDQITDGINGLIVETTDEGIASGIEACINDAQLRESFISNLALEKLGTEEEINKLYEIFC
ncbi:glycosyltransferase [Paenibacillus chondroitinus]|uniref:Glycosyltransferase n=1 Tax=Paenibacillus chondroitinus TaxID=59842 RepID=A0ABU6DLF8_9BACL|nr:MULTISPECIES: glycosyltransferase [Paenibacillus]MCY9660250.1 glycosyltransferase [Paenibacillus anseongense]MEB4797676.1 glycosyltransferase [Paenibacillus chondroitinus]